MCVCGGGGVDLGLAGEKEDRCELTISGVLHVICG